MDARIVVAGEALIDLMVGDDPRHPTACPGGSPANTAVALARLGEPVAFAGRFGDDRFGDMLLANLSANDVDLGYAIEADEPASIAVVTTGTDRGARYQFHVTGTADWAWREHELPTRLPDSVTAVHAGSLAMALPPGADVLARWFAAQRAHRVTSFDPNIRPALVGPRERYVPWLESVVATCDVVKVSTEDLAWAYPDDDPERILGHWHAELGVTLAVLTKGGSGATAIAAGRSITRPATVVDVGDTVGAGDAFSAGLLHWLAEHDLLTQRGLSSLTDDDISAALDYAAMVAGLACGKHGADPPTREEVEAAFAGA